MNDTRARAPHTCGVVMTPQPHTYIYAYAFRIHPAKQHERAMNTELVCSTTSVGEFLDDLCFRKILKQFNYVFNRQ